MGNGLIALRADGHLASYTKIAPFAARVVDTCTQFERFYPFLDIGLADEDSTTALAWRALLLLRGVSPPGLPARGTLQHAFAFAGVLAPKHSSLDQSAVLAAKTLAEIRLI